MTLSLKNRYLASASIIALAFLSVLFFNISHSKAAITVYQPSTCYTAAASSTLTYQTPGTATSSVSCLVGPNGADSAVVTAQINASSTNSAENFFAEESFDGQDWYPINLGTQASTSPGLNLSLRNPYTYTFASSTIFASSTGSIGNHLGVNGSNNRNDIIFSIPVRMRYLRVEAACVLAGTNCGIWMQIIPKVNVN